MPDTRSNLLTRDDTFLGVCAGLGEDLGFNPLWLRLAFAIGLLWNPTAMVAAYLGLGLVVAVSRLLAPSPAAARPSAGEPAAAEAEPKPVAAGGEEGPEPVPLAA